MEYLSTLYNLSNLELLYVIFAVLLASILRGMTGFGFSIAMVIILTFFMDPATATVYILLWEVCCSMVHLPFVWRSVNWKLLTWLTLGMFAGTPIGVWVLTIIPVEPMILIINFTIFILGICILRGYGVRRDLTPIESTSTGVIAGICNGAFANAGLPVILLFFSSPTGIAVGRASVIAFFLVTDIWASLLFIAQGITTRNIFLGAMLFLPIIMLGIWLGTKLFAIVPTDKFQKFAMLLLLFIAFIGIVRVVATSFF